MSDLYIIVNTLVNGDPILVPPTELDSEFFPDKETAYEYLREYFLYPHPHLSVYRCIEEKGEATDASSN